jgi:hypothetical protein
MPGKWKISCEFYHIKVFYTTVVTIVAELHKFYTLLSPPPGKKLDVATAPAPALFYSRQKLHITIANLKLY